MNGAEMAAVSRGGGVVALEPNLVVLDASDALDDRPVMVGDDDLAGTRDEPAPANEGVARGEGGRHTVPRHPVEPEGPEFHGLGLFGGGFGGGEDVGDFGDEIEEFLAVGWFDRVFGLPGSFGSAPEQIM